MTSPVSSKLLALLGLLIGWLLILRVGHWHLTVSVFFLLLGWASVVLIARYLWEVATSDTEPKGTFGVTGGRREDLLREKRSLLKPTDKANDE